MSKNTELDAPTRPVLTLMGELQERSAATLGDAGKAEITAQSVDRIMEADSLDALFDAVGVSKLTSSQDLENVPIRVASIEVRASDQKYAAGGLGAFVVAQYANLETGELGAMGTGAPKLVAFFVKAEKLGALPIDVVIRGKETSGGTMLYLEKWGK